jgi:MFS family permease
MAVFDFAWSVPGAIGMYLAGLIMDNFDPRWIWYAAGLVGILAAFAFLVLHIQQRQEGESVPVPEPSA